jgi:NADH-quinone oxidoreductase subunit N
MDLVMMYISLELVSIAGYVLAGFSRDTEHGAEASLKYILFGALSSGLMIYGFSFFYGLTGTTNIIAIRQVLALSPAMHSGANYYMLWTATILALAGMFYKISAVPFHFWTPDVYEGAPAPVTAFLSVASKAAGFGMLLRFLLFTFPDSGKTGLPMIDWHPFIAVLAVLTMTFGNFAALQQTNVRRLLAYSSIAHAGYMLAALALGRTGGTVAIMIYLTTYIFMQLGAFYAVMLIENKIGSEEIDDYRGLAGRTPLAASALVIFLLSLTGIPLTAGFIGKFYLLTALLTPNPATHQVQWIWLSVALVLNSVISLYYYLRVAAAMFLKRSLREMAIDRMEVETDRASVAPAAYIIYSIPSAVLLIGLIVPVIALGVYFQPLVDFASGVVRFFNFENLRY